MLTVALTGSIAVGKSYVLEQLGALGCYTMDADEIARDLMRPCQPAYHEIVREFGTGIVAGDGTLDRARLATLVFADGERRERLNRIVHPRVREEIRRRVGEIAARDPQAIIVIAAALVIEAGVQGDFDALVVVHCDREAQIARLMLRDGLSREEALARIAAQLSSEEKLRYADYAIDTSGSLDDTGAQVE
ncbi:MAG TPA: dephospho-CoA kinase, partial [Blastocatellia bacterium]|nr:dephospho-CoA kinase [Blastocatellia bacterium]